MLRFKPLLFGVLPAVLAAELLLGPGMLFDVAAKRQEPVIYTASGIVDKLLPSATRARFENIVSDGVIGEPVSATTAGVKPLDIRLEAKGLELRGITITQGNRFALIWDTTKMKSIIAQEGDSINSIKLLAIQQDRVRVLEAEQEKDILLRKKPQ